MYANFLAHPDLFLSIGSGTTPEERIIYFVEYYLTAFHEGRKGAVAKKPYNPIIGETFHCSWHVPKDKVKPFRTNTASAVSEDQTKGVGQDPSECYKLRFVAEQVSHHPPISCFYCECKEKMMCANAHVWTKSKFMGMSVGVSMVGEGKNKLQKIFLFFYSMLLKQIVRYPCRKVLPPNHQSVKNTPEVVTAIHYLDYTRFVFLIYILPFAAQ